MLKRLLYATISLMYKYVWQKTLKWVPQYNIAHIFYTVCFILAIFINFLSIGPQYLVETFSHLRTLANVEMKILTKYPFILTAWH